MGKDASPHAACDIVPAIARLALTPSVPEMDQGVGSECPSSGHDRSNGRMGMIGSLPGAWQFGGRIGPVWSEAAAPGARPHLSSAFMLQCIAAYPDEWQKNHGGMRSRNTASLPSRST